MEFRIANTFTDSLTRLTADEQKAARLTAFDLQVDHSAPGLRFHKLEKAKDKGFWSVRASGDIRLIVHRTDSSILLCYVDHHDKAYDWAERRKIEVHPKTGAAQLVELKETVQNIVVPVYVQAPNPKPPAPDAAPVLAHVSDEDLLSYGVPLEWLQEVKAASQDELLALTERLPQEASEALLELAIGGTPRKPVPVAPGTDPFDHPDAQRRFRVMANVEALQAALEYPWEKWTVFLHPDQQQLVERSFAGPVRVAGSAGTGKTIVALHRAAFLARANSGARVLLTTFTDTLASALQTKLRRLLAGEPRLAERIDVYSLEAIGIRLYKGLVGTVALVSPPDLQQILGEAAQAVPGHSFGPYFLRTEWEHVVDAWQLGTWEAYRDVARLGRRTRLPEPKRATLWAIFERVRLALRMRSLVTNAEMFTTLSNAVGGQGKPPFDFVVIDEAQDLSVAQLRLLAALAGGRPDGLFLAGDLGQRIFQQPFSWKALGVDIRGRSKTLRVNYRTSHQIRQQADRLLGEMLTDVDGIEESRKDTVSVFNGPAPMIQAFPNESAETAFVGAWLSERIADGLLPHECGVFVRSDSEIARARAAVSAAGLKLVVLEEQVETAGGYVSVSTMHLAKGLEFRAVVVMACDDEVIPLQARIEAVGDEGDLREVYETERQLLYVACTRARDQLLVTGVVPESEFLADLAGQR